MVAVGAADGQPLLGAIGLDIGERHVGGCDGCHCDGIAQILGIAARIEGLRAKLGQSLEGRREAWVGEARADRLWRITVII